MPVRPWPIVILALLHILAPIGNLVFSAGLSHQSLWDFTRTLAMQDGAWGIIDFFVLLPVAGVALYICKKWSYPIFLLVSLQTVYVNFMTWKSAPTVFTMPMLAITGILDIVFVSYFMIPAVRKTYLDPSVRWWEAKPRYPVQLPASVLPLEGGTVSCEVTDLSEGGAFVRSETPFEADAQVVLNFRVLEQDYSVKSRVVYRRGGANPGYGLRFQFHSRSERTQLRRLAHGLFLLGIRPRNQVDWKEDLIGWTRDLITEGKGLVPQAKRPSLPTNVVSLDAARETKRPDRDVA